MNNPQSLATLIPLIFNEEHQWKYQLLKNWQAIFGKLSDKVYLERIQQDVLTLAVYDACWMHELYALSEILLASINKTLDKPYIKQLRFKRAGIRPKKTNTDCQSNPCKKQHAITLTTQEQRILDNIKDHELAAALKDFLVRCYKERSLYGLPNTCQGSHHSDKPNPIKTFGSNRIGR